jgi:hypothetical protein
MIKDISINNDDSIFNWHLDISKFKEKYPTVYNAYKNSLLELDYFEVSKIIPDGESIEEIIIKKEVVMLFLSDETEQRIFNTELINLLGITFCEDWLILCDDQFVYFILTVAHHQKGALAIWDVKKKLWIFNHVDETFCVEDIIYSKKKIICS